MEEKIMYRKVEMSRSDIMEFLTTKCADEDLVNINNFVKGKSKDEQSRSLKYVYFMYELNEELCNLDPIVIIERYGNFNIDCEYFTENSYDEYEEVYDLMDVIDIDILIDFLYNADTSLDDLLINLG